VPNRLANNSLLEGLVFGARAADGMTAPLRTANLRESDVVAWPSAIRRPPTIDVPSADDVRTVMWQHCGLLRDGRGMEQAITRLEAWHALIGAAPRRMPTASSAGCGRCTVGLMIARAALRREEAAAATFARTFRIATT
jgi:L-aspartate oxidase